MSAFILILFVGGGSGGGGATSAEFASLAACNFAASEAEAHFEPGAAVSQVRSICVPKDLPAQAERSDP